MEKGAELSMELEFERDHLHDHETVLDTTLCQEETLEASVPDACPDIRRIVDCCGQVCLTGKQAQDGAAAVSGVIRAAVLYQPEGGTTLKKLELSLPFSCRAECAAMTQAAEIVASPRLRRIEARALNPRKVLLRVDLAVDLLVLQPRERTICTQATEESGNGLCQLWEQRETYILSAVRERPFSMSETVRLPVGDGVEILSCRGTALCGESRLIGSKLIFKGSIDLQLLLQDGSGGLTAHQESLAFSQVMEAAGAGEDSTCDMDVELTDLSWQPAGEDGRSIEISAELLAQAMVWERRPLQLLRDLYSTSCLTQVQTEELALTQLVDRSVRTQSVRELLETAAPAHSAVDCWLSLGQVEQQREGDGVNVTAQIQLTALYLNDEGQLQSVQRAAQAVCRVECPQEAECRVRCRWSGEMFAALAAGGVEVRCSLDFFCTVLARQSVTMAVRGELGEKRAAEAGEQPSVVLRLAAPGERLWDIAKAYGTTREEIRLANGLEEDETSEHTMLLIPRVR